MISCLTVVHVGLALADDDADYRTSDYIDMSDYQLNWTNLQGPALQSLVDQNCRLYYVQPTLENIRRSVWRQHQPDPENSIDPWLAERISVNEYRSTT